MVKDAYQKGLAYMEAGDPERARLWLCRADTIYSADDSTYEAVGEALTEDCSDRIGTLEEEPCLTNQLTAQVEEWAEELEESQLRLWGLMSMARLAQLGKKLSALPGCRALGQLEMAVQLILRSFTAPISGQEFGQLEALRDELYELSDAKDYWNGGEIAVPGSAPFQVFDLNGMLVLLGLNAYLDSHLAYLVGEEEGAPQQPAAILCPRCASHNPAGNIFCQVCGHQLTAGQVPGAPGPAPAPEGQQGYRRADQEPVIPDIMPGPAALPQWFLRNIFSELEEGPELCPGVSRRDVCDYVGPNSFIFLMRFQQLLEPGVHLSINWSAFLFSFFYCFYRKMYKMGVVLLCLTIASVVPVLLAFMPLMPTFSEMLQQGALTVESLNALLQMPIAQPYVMASNIASFVQLAIRLFCGLFFHPAYCKQVCRGIQTVRERGHFSSGSPEYRYALIRQGGVNANAVLLAFCSLMVLYILGAYLLLMASFPSL